MFGINFDFEYFIKDNMYVENLCLAIIQIGDDIPSSIYVGMKMKKCDENNYSYIHVKIDDMIANYSIFSNNQSYKRHLMPILDSVLQSDNNDQPKKRKLRNIVQQLSNIQFIDGVLIQLPLPQDLLGCIEEIPWYKDVDGLTSYNQGMLFRNAEQYKYFAPCTPLACMYILQNMCTDICTKNIAVFGKSNLVGKPITAMLQSAGASVISIDKHNPAQHELSSICDGIISAMGLPHYITPKYLKKDAFFIDIGVRKIQKKLFGDLHDNAKVKTSWYTPHVKGIGPLTIWFLMENLRKSRQLYALHHNKN